MDALLDICARRGTFPSPYIISGELAKVDDSRIDFNADSDLWEGTYRGKQVHIMSMEDAEMNNDVRGSHLVLDVFAAHGYPRVPQDFIEIIFSLKRLRHPNIVPIIGVTMDPLQIVAERTSDRSLMEYLREYPEADRTGLVSPLPLSHLTDTDNVILFRVAGRG